MSNDDYRNEMCVPFDLYEGSPRPVYMTIDNDGSTTMTEDVVRQTFAMHGKDWAGGVGLYLMMPGTYEIIQIRFEVERVTTKEEIEEWGDYNGLLYRAEARRIDNGRTIIGPDYKPVTIMYVKGTHTPAKIRKAYQ